MLPRTAGAPPTIPTTSPKCPSPHLLGQPTKPSTNPAPPTRPQALQRGPRRAARALVRASSTSPTLEVLSQDWEQLEKAVESSAKNFKVFPGAKPALSPPNTLPSERESLVKSSKPVVLIRDTNAWCPFCERVWLALEEKGIPYDNVLISLQNKPEWYTELVPTKKVPAMSFANPDGRKELIWESKDILLELEDRFPEVPLLPSDPGLKAEALTIMDELENSHDVGAAGFKFMAGGSMFNRAEPRDPAQLPMYQEEFERELHWMEGILAKRGGPFFLGAMFSVVDIMFVSFMERLVAGLPVFRGYILKDSPKFPHISQWVSAINGRAAYQRVKTDDYTYRLLFSRMGGMQPYYAPLSLDAATMEARRSVAARITKNKTEIVADIMKNSGLLPFAVASNSTTSDNGSSQGPATPPSGAEVIEAVEFHLRRLCSLLLTGIPGPKAGDAVAKAVGAATLAFFRNRATSPRDMTAPEADQFRTTIDELLQDVY